MAAEAPIGSVSVGRYRLDVGGAAGTLIAPLPAPPEGDVARLAHALEQEPRTAGEAAGEIVDSASEVATRVEQAVALAKDLAAGRIDPRDVSGHVDLMLDILERLDGQGRWEEERRLARALNGVLALLFRWVDLVRSLKVLRAAAERFGDRSAVAWSEHELGTLHLAGGDIRGANWRLEEAERIRREIDDRAGLTATEQSLRVLCQQLREELRDDGGRPRRGRHLLLLASAAILLLLLGGVAGAMLDRDDPPDDDDQAALGGEEARLAVQTEGAGSVTSAPAGIRCPDRCEGEFPRGSGIVLTARPTGDATFAGWSGGGCQGTARCELRLGRDTTVTASFKETQPSTAILRIEPPSNGAVTSDPAGISCPQTCERTFASGTQVALIAAAAQGFAFAEWSGDCSGSDCLVTMTADRNVAASFVPTATPTVEVTVTVLGTGTVTSQPGGIDCTETCSASFEAGEQIVLTGTSDNIDWEGPCTVTDSSCTLTPEANTSVTAAFPDVPDIQ
jgi:Divergent InlB B-repeat domain